MVCHGPIRGFSGVLSYLRSSYILALHEHLREHMLVGFFFAARYAGARSTRVRTGLNLPSTVSHLKVFGSSTSGWRDRSCAQTWACKCARRMCSFQAPAVGVSFSTPWSSFSWWKIYHRNSAASLYHNTFWAKEAAEILLASPDG